MDHPDLMVSGFMEKYIGLKSDKTIILMQIFMNSSGGSRMDSGGSLEPPFPPPPVFKYPMKMRK